MDDLLLYKGLNQYRKDALKYEQSINTIDRKKFGQFFTGLPLARLLAAIAHKANHKSIIDPMAGTGDLLDAVSERAFIERQKGINLNAIELDSNIAKHCRRRLNFYKQNLHENVNIIVGNVFVKEILDLLPDNLYDLVITNPPFVRYQTFSKSNGDKRVLSGQIIRKSLLEIIDLRAPEQEKAIWKFLVKEYSGLADLSIPSWILCSLLVKPGGTLALVAPSTWRTRNYGVVIQYLLQRFYKSIIIVEDCGPGWFSDALVRTTLVVAQKYQTSQSMVPLKNRNKYDFLTVRVSPNVRKNGSIIGASFTGPDYEGQFAKWLSRLNTKHGSTNLTGIEASRKNSKKAFQDFMISSKSVKWLANLETSPTPKSNIFVHDISHRATIPEAIRDIIKFKPQNLITLNDLPIGIGQGLRTGCNSFFYVTFRDKAKKGFSKVDVSSELGGGCFVFPNDILIPVVRKQEEIKNSKLSLQRIRGRVLVLENYVLPNDYATVSRCKGVYSKSGELVPILMRDDVENYVLKASTSKVLRNGVARLIPELSAVHTNVRKPNPKTPRFWYMLPRFTQRHIPNAFIPRINHETPRLILNEPYNFVVDANFSTLWLKDSNVTLHMLNAIFKSEWIKACMEAVGTTMGGGALKLEASHLRNLPIPSLSQKQMQTLDKLGKSKTNEFKTSYLIDAILIKAFVGDTVTDTTLKGIRNKLEIKIKELVKSRKRYIK